MVVTIDKGKSKEEILSQIKGVYQKLKERRKEEKRALLNTVAGKIIFDKNKTPLEIQKEMRDDWS